MAGAARSVSVFLRLLCIPAGVLTAGAGAGTVIAVRDGIVAGAVPAGVVALLGASYLAWAGWEELSVQYQEEAPARDQEPHGACCPWAGPHAHAQRHAAD